MSTDLERLTESLDRWDDLSPVEPTDADVDVFVEAARAYRDLLTNGTEPDYEAAADMLHEYVHLLNHGVEEPGMKWTRDIVLAAIGDKLLIDPTTEEER